MLSARIKSIFNNVMRADGATNGASMHENMRVEYFRDICSGSSAMLPAPRCPLRTSRSCNKVMSRWCDGRRECACVSSANEHARACRVMRARTSPQVLHAQPFDGSLAWYVSMATGKSINITRTDTHGYGLRARVGTSTGRRLRRVTCRETRSEEEAAVNPGIS